MRRTNGVVRDEPAQLSGHRALKSTTVWHFVREASSRFGERKASKRHDASYNVNSCKVPAEVRLAAQKESGITILK